MPTYEYKCEQCGTIFEKRQRFSDQPLTTHPECGGPVHRLLSAPAFQLKGTGWYATDYPKVNSNGSSSSGNGGKSETPKSDSAPKTESTTPASSTTAATETKNP